MQGNTLKRGKHLAQFSQADQQSKGAKLATDPLRIPPVRVFDSHPNGQILSD